MYDVVRALFREAFRQDCNPTSQHSIVEIVAAQSSVQKRHRKTKVGKVGGKVSQRIR